MFTNGKGSLSSPMCVDSQNAYRGDGMQPLVEIEKTSVVCTKGKLGSVVFQQETIIPNSGENIKNAGFLFSSERVFIRRG